MFAGCKYLFGASKAEIIAKMEQCKACVEASSKRRIAMTRVETAKIKSAPKKPMSIRRH